MPGSEKAGWAALLLVAASLIGRRRGPQVRGKAVNKLTMSDIQRALEWIDADRAGRQCDMQRTA